MVSSPATILRLLGLLSAFYAVSSAPAREARATSQLLVDLLPVAPLQSWTTCADSASVLPLSDATLQPFKVASGVTHTYLPFAGKSAMQAVFPNGSYTFSHEPRGGISFYAPGAAALDLTTAKEATFGYSVYFQDGFEWNKGGKLPGFCECPRTGCARDGSSTGAQMAATPRTARSRAPAARGTTLGAFRA